MIHYELSSSLKNRAVEIINSLGLDYININNLFFVKTSGSKSKYTRARCHGLISAWQFALSIKPHYIIEVINNFFDKLSDEDKDKIIIHELLHIPFTFSGALRNHVGFNKKELVTKRVVDKYYKLFKKGVKLSIKPQPFKPSVSFDFSEDVSSRVNLIINRLSLNHLSSNHIKCVKVNGSVMRSPLMIIPLPRIWQLALNVKPHYLLEATDKFFKLSEELKLKWVIKWLLFIPNNFSGAIINKKLSVDLINRAYECLRFNC